MCRIRSLLILILIAMLALPVTGQAAGLHEELHCSSLTVDVTVGYDGVMTYGKTMPVRVRLENHGADMSCTVAVNTYVNRRQYNRYEMETTLAAAAAKELVLPVFVGSKQETFTVEVWQEGVKLCAVNAQPTQVLHPAAMLVGVLSDTPQSLAYMNIDMATDTLLRNEYIQTLPLTAQTFPDSLDLLSSFGVLAVDGFDVSLLAPAQQQALQAWLEAGHILIVGGGAQASTAWPSFASFTGLTPGQLQPVGGVAAALLQWLEISGDPLEEEITLTSADGGLVLAQAQDAPLIWRSQAGSGVIYTTAFSLSDKALVNWAPMHTFWQRLMIKDCFTLYQQGFQSYTNEPSYAYEASRIPLSNDVPLLPAALAGTLILVVGGAAAYILLKRTERRQWLWLILPALAALGTAVVCIMAVSSAAARPTVLSLSVLQQDETGLMTRHLALNVATPQRGEQLITVSDGVLRPINEEHYYDYDESNKLPSALNYRYILGARSGLGVDMGTPWNARYFRVKNAPVPQGSVDSSVWMEDDGLHGYIHNLTSMHLSEGAFLCRYGYCSVPALAPGERYEFTLMKSIFAVPDQHVYEDGKMYEALLGRNMQPYAFVEEYFFKTSQLPQGETHHQDPEKRSMANLMIQAVDQSYMNRQNYGFYYTPKFHYAAFPQEIPEVDVLVNGQSVERTASRAILHALVPYAPTNPTGQFYRMPGLDIAQRAQLDSNGTPYFDPEAAADTRDYHRISEQPVFMFRLGKTAGLTISRMAFFTEYMPKGAQTYLYNGSEWLPCEMNKDVAEPFQYVDEEGCIYLQFRMPTATEDYYEVYTPSMLLEGRMN